MLSYKSARPTRFADFLDRIRLMDGNFNVDFFQNVCILLPNQDLILPADSFRPDRSKSSNSIKIVSND